ncbi:MAG: AAA family ATPase [Saprospiraceae bacterium]
MKFVIIFGPSAVGKMSVGRALAEKTELKLYHNHMSIEAVRPVFDFGTPEFNRLVELNRIEMFKTAAKSDLKGLIFTFVWALDRPKEFEYISRAVKIFEEQNAEIFYIELEASLETRLIRNKHEIRLLEKPSKRNMEVAESVLYYEEKYQLNTEEGKFDFPNHLKINNEKLKPEEVAKMIVEHFGW